MKMDRFPGQTGQILLDERGHYFLMGRPLSPKLSYGFQELLCNYQIILSRNDKMTHLLEIPKKFSNCISIGWKYLVANANIATSWKQDYISLEKWYSLLSIGNGNCYSWTSSASSKRSYRTDVHSRILRTWIRNNQHTSVFSRVIW